DHGLLLFSSQAGDDIRDDLVTGVQTCALPIWPSAVERGETVDGGFGRPAASARDLPILRDAVQDRGLPRFQKLTIGNPLGIELRSEERRVGKAWRSRWSQEAAESNVGLADETK